MPTRRQSIRLHSAQAEYRRSPALYRGFVGGRGAGKTWIGAYDLIRRAKPGRTYLIASPTAVVMGDTTLPTFRAIAESLGVWGEIKLTPYPTATLTTGAVVRFRTAENPDRMRGPNLSGVWLDEASLMPEAAYGVCIAALREGGEQGWLGATFTPRGPLHWTYTVLGTGRPDTALVRAKTRDNPFNNAAFAATLQRQYGDTLFARQELDGEFVSLEGAEFPPEWLAGDDLWFDAWPADLVLKVIALDPSKGTDGRGVDDQAHALVGVGVRGGDVALYADADLRREPVQEMVRRTVRLAREWMQTGRAVDSIVAEDNATMGLLPEAIRQATAGAGLVLPWECQTSRGNKEYRIRLQLGGPLSRRQVRFRRTPGGRALVAQLQAFPFGEKDDGIDALATAMQRVGLLLATGGRRR